MDLVVPRQQRLECALLKAITARYVMTRAGVITAQARERELLTELAHAIERGAPQTWTRCCARPGRRPGPTRRAAA